MRMGVPVGRTIVLLKIFYFSFFLYVFFSFSSLLVGREGLSGVSVSRRWCARRPSRVYLFTDDQQGTLAAHIYGRVTEQWGVTRGWRRNGGVHTDSLSQGLVTDWCMT